jgi:suppressor for copper-sensitivity B
VNLPKTANLSAAVVLALLFVPSSAHGVASKWSVNPQSRVRLISPWQVAPRGGELILGLQFRLAPGWHVYWKNSGDAGFPPAVTFQPAEILGKPELLWPTPSRFELPGGLVAFGYEGEVVYPVRATIWPDALPSPVASHAGASSFFIRADLDYLTCKIDCVPYRYRLTLEQPVGDQPVADPETSPLLQTWLDRLPLALEDLPGLKLSTLLDAGSPGGPELEVRLLGVTAQAGKADLFLESNESFDAGRPRARVFPNGVIFHVPLKPRQVSKPLPAKVLLAWTASNLSAKSGESFAIDSRREVEVRTAASAKRGDRSPETAQAAGRLLRLLLWALLGGALLNLTPAPLALLAGEVLVLRQAGGPEARERAAAAATGVVGASWGVAALALATRRAGLPVAWGAQEPALGALLAVAAAWLALNLWGLVATPFAPAGSSRPGTGRHLLAGLFAVPLALAWPAPLLREPFGYAAGHGPAMVSGVFAVVGFGLALPYLLLALAPALARPAPGVAARVPRLREGLGFLAGAGALWTLHGLSRQVSPEGLAWIELALLGMALLAWLRARESSGKALRFALALGLAACAAGALWLADRNRLASLAAAAQEPLPNPQPIHGLPPAVREPIPNQTSGG